MILQLQDFIVDTLKTKIPNINVEKVPEKVGKTAILNPNNIYVSYDGSRYEGEGSVYHGIREMRFNVQIISKKLYGDSSIFSICEKVMEAMVGLKYKGFAIQPFSDELTFYEPDIWICTFVFKIKQPVLEVR